MASFAYVAAGWDPPAPVLTVNVSARVGAAPTVVTALLDTGADACVMPFRLATDVGVALKTERTFQGFVDGVRTSYAVPVGRVHLVLPEGLGSGNIEVLLHDFEHGQQYMILGRSLLNLWQMNFDGPNLEFEIST